MLPVTIVIPVFNKVDLTKQCLEAIVAAGDIPEKVVVVDNASTDGTADYLRKAQQDYITELTVITNEHNTGFAIACNQGAAASDTEHIVFLNNDTIPTGGWLTALLAAGKAESVGAVGCLLLYPDDTVQHAGVSIAVTDDGYILPFHIYRFSAKNTSFVTKRRELQVVTAACMLARKAVFDQVQGFDERYKNGYEDVDFCFKLRAAGYSVIYEPSAVVYHLESQTPGRMDHTKPNDRLLQESWGGTIAGDWEEIVEGDGLVSGELFDGPYAISVNTPRRSLEVFITPGDEDMEPSVMLPSIVTILRRQTDQSVRINLLDPGYPFDIRTLPDKSARLASFNQIWTSATKTADTWNWCLANSEADRVLIVEPDVYLPLNYSSYIEEALSSEERIGLVGPHSTAGYQGGQTFSAGDIDQVDKLNAMYLNWADNYRGVRLNSGVPGPFAFALTREAINCIGGFDNQFSTTSASWLDYLLRLTAEGFKIGLAAKLAVMHLPCTQVDAEGELLDTEFLSGSGLAEKWSWTKWPPVLMPKDLKQVSKNAQGSQSRIDPGALSKDVLFSAGQPFRRNAPCPCGSGQKYKKCHGSEAAGRLPSSLTIT